MATRYLIPPVSFEFSRPSAISFTVQKARTLLIDIADITVGADTHAHYEGEYVITPRTYQQLLETDNKVCDDDITVLTIPMAKVTNIQGGFTATIG